MIVRCITVHLMLIHCKVHVVLLRVIYVTLEVPGSQPIQLFWYEDVLKTQIHLEPLLNRVITHTLSVYIEYTVQI